MLEKGAIIIIIVGPYDVFVCVDILFRVLPTLCHLILTAVLWGRWDQLHFAEGGLVFSIEGGKTTHHKIILLLESFVMHFFCSISKHLFRRWKDTKMAKPQSLVSVHFVIIKNTWAKWPKVKYSIPGLPLEFITFFFLLLSCVFIGVEIIVTFPRDVNHSQEMSQEELQENK